VCRCFLPPHPASSSRPAVLIVPACCCSLRCGFSGNDCIRSSRLEQIVCINADDSLAYGTHVGLPARGELVYSRPCRAATRTSNVSLVFRGKPEGNLPRCRIRWRGPHLSFDDSLALSRNLFSRRTWGALLLSRS